MNRKQVPVSVSSLARSHMIEGRFEKDIVSKVAQFFRNKGYEVRDHASLNVAWGQALCEVDVVAVKNDEITLVEVKSRRDKISKASNQIERLLSIIDYSYVASDASIRSNNFDRDVGILSVNNEVCIVRNANKVKAPVPKNFLIKLKKKCLDRLQNGNDRPNRMKKEHLANLITGKIDADELKREVKKIVFCSQKCDDCPL